MEQQRYASLQDYVRVLQRHRILIGVLTLVAGLGALAYSLSQSNRYEASADISFRDILADIDLFSGDDSPPEISPQQRATIAAQRLTRPEVTDRVQRNLDTSLEDSEVTERISTQVSVQTNLVQVTAESSDPEFAADLANAYARAARALGTREAISRLREAERTLRPQLREARRDLPQTTFQVGVLQNQLQRVQSLREVAEPVEIERSATVPEDPVSPRPVRNTMLGVIVGLLAGLLAAFVRDALDRRVHSPQDIHHELGRPILGRVSGEVFGHTGLVKNPDGRVMRPEDFEAFRVLRTNLAYLKEGGPRTVLVTSATPGEGKTTVSVSLASAVAVAGQSVLLVETDLRRPVLAGRLGIAPTPGLTDFLAGRAKPAEILQVVDLVEPPVMNGAQPASVSTGRARLVCITAGTSESTGAELLGSPAFADFLSKVGRAYDLVVLDTSPLLAVADPIRLAPMVDSVIVCVRADKTTRDEIGAAREILARVPDESSGAVVTGITRGGPDDYDYYYGY